MNRILPRIANVTRSPASRVKAVGLRKLTSKTSASASAKTHLSLRPFAALGGASVVAVYFLWPDNSRSAPTCENAKLSPTHFTPVIVTASDPCSIPEARLITLTIPPQSLPDIKDTSFWPIWSIFIKDDDIQVERPYTPLEGVDERGRMKFWIKRYAKGEVGRWILSKTVGEQIEIRGPLKTWPWTTDQWDDIVMISGGTGITPFYQLLYQELFSQPPNLSKARFTLLHSSRTPKELPPPEILEPIMTYAEADPTRLSFSLYVDSLDGDSASAIPRRVLHEGRIGRRALEAATGLDVDIPWWQRLHRTSSLTQRVLEADRKVLFLVCGPEPMVAAIAGSFGRNMSQGPVGGILGEMGYKSEQVWKL